MIDSAPGAGWIFEALGRSDVRGHHPAKWALIPFPLDELKTAITVSLI